MQVFDYSPPEDLIEQLENFDATGLTDAMLKKAAEDVAAKVKSGAMKAFKHDASRIVDCMIVSKSYDTPSDGGRNIKIGFDGYFINSDGYKTPAPLVVNVIEYGYSDGSRKHPFFRKCFKKSAINKLMTEAQDAYLEEHWSAWNNPMKGGGGE